MSRKKKKTEASTLNKTMPATITRNNNAGVLMSNAMGGNSFSNQSIQQSTVPLAIRSYYG